jgi:hypothetical protein
MAEINSMIIREVIKETKTNILFDVERCSKNNRYGKRLIDYDDCLAIITDHLSVLPLKMETELKLCKEFVK